MGDVTYFTKEGLEEIKRELRDLKTRGRSDIAAQIKEAREKGDLSENAEYDAAKEAQGLLELKISKVEEVLGKARILDESQIDTSRVSVLSTISVKNLKNNKVVSYKLVSEKEANFKNGKISVTSPIGKGLLGKKVGEIAEIQVPSGYVQFEVIEITV